MTQAAQVGFTRLGPAIPVRLMNAGNLLAMRRASPRVSRFMTLRRVSFAGFIGAVSPGDSQLPQWGRTTSRPPPTYGLSCTRLSRERRLP
jgi:hypothetical protein